MKILVILIALAVTCLCKSVEKNKLKDPESTGSPNDDDGSKLFVYKKPPSPTTTPKPEVDEDENNVLYYMFDTPQLFSGGEKDTPQTVLDAKPGAIVTYKGIQHIWRSKQTRQDSFKACTYERHILCEYYFQHTDAETMPQKLDVLLPEIMPKKLDVLEPETIPPKLDALVPETIPKNLDALLPETMPKILDTLEPETMRKQLDVLVSETMPQKLDAQVSETMPQKLDALMPETMPKKLDVLLPETMPKNLDALLPETMPKKLDALMPETMPKKLDVLLPETMPKNLDALLPETMPKKLDALMPETMSKKLDVLLPETMPKNLDALLPETMPQKLDTLEPETMPPKLDALVPETIPKRLDALVPETMPKILDVLVSETMPQKLDAQVSETMPQKLDVLVSETMPQKLVAQVSETMPKKLAALVPETMPKKLDVLVSETMPQKLDVLVSETISKQMHNTTSTLVSLLKTTLKPASSPEAEFTVPSTTEIPTKPEAKIVIEVPKVPKIKKEFIVKKEDLNTLKQMSPTLMMLTKIQRVLSEALQSLNRQLAEYGRQVSHLDASANEWSGRLYHQEENHKTLSDAVATLSGAVRELRNDALKSNNRGIFLLTVWKGKCEVNLKKYKILRQLRSHMDVMEKSYSKLQTELSSTRMDLHLKAHTKEQGKKVDPAENLKLVKKLNSFQNNQELRDVKMKRLHKILLGNKFDNICNEKNKDNHGNAVQKNAAIAGTINLLNGNYLDSLGPKPNDNHTNSEQGLQKNQEILFCWSLVKHGITSRWSVSPTVNA